MISVIIPVYNQADKIGQTLKSLLAQTYQDLEIIIVNDGSSDHLDQALEVFFSKNKTNLNILILHQNNQGAPAARNAGFKKSHGEYILFCDADASLEPQALELMLKTLLVQPDISYVYSSFLWGKKLFKLGPFDENKLKQMPYIHTMSLVRRSDLPLNGWDENIKKLQDWDLWLTMLESGRKGFWLDQVLFKIQTGGHISSWLPAMAYKVFPFLPSVKKYNQAMAIIKAKHNL